MMTDFAAVPNTDGALVLTQDGFIYCVSPGGPPELFADMSDMIVDNGDTEEGLLTLIFHPAYPAEPYVYIYRNAPKSAGQSGFAWYDRISRFEVNLDSQVLDLGSEEIVIQVMDPQIQHNGAGPIGFGPDGYLYASFGDGGLFAWDTYASQHIDASQYTDTLLGKILRIDVLNPPEGEPYGIPEDNPFFDGAGPNADEIWAYGVRNPWRGAIDPVTGDLWVAEVGDGAYDEVIGIVPAGNYGWPIREGPVCWHDREPCDPPPDYIEANVNIPHSGAAECAVIGGVIYRGSQMPELDGWFIYSDYCTGDIWGIDTQDGAATPVKLADVEPAMPITSIRTLPDGELAIVPYLTGGILTLEPKP